MKPLLLHWKTYWLNYLVAEIIGLVLVASAAAWWDAAGRQREDITTYTSEAAYRVTDGDAAAIAYLLNANTISDELVIITTTDSTNPTPEPEIELPDIDARLELVQNKATVSTDRRDVSPVTVVIILIIIGTSALVGLSTVLAYEVDHNEKLETRFIKDVLDTALPQEDATRLLQRMRQKSKAETW